MADRTGPRGRGRPSTSSSKPIFNKPIRSYEPPYPETREPEPNFNLLDESLKDELRKKAAAKVEAKEKERAEQAFLDKAMEELERELHPEAYEETKELEVDLAVYADRIILDGKHYMHGRVYKVKKSVYDSMQDIIYRTKLHQADTHRDPERVMQERAQAIAKGGPSLAVLSAANPRNSQF